MLHCKKIPFLPKQINLPDRKTEIYIMGMDCVEDGRKITDDVMFYVRRMTVNAVRELGYSSEKRAVSLN